MRCPKTGLKVKIIPCPTCPNGSWDHIGVAMIRKDGKYFELSCGNEEEYDDADDWCWGKLKGPWDIGILLSAFERYCLCFTKTEWLKEGF